MDEIDSQIVALLRENARRSLQDIGAHVSLSAPAVKRRVDRLQETGVIRGYAAVVDPSKLGWNTLAIVSLYCEGRMSAAEVRGRGVGGGTAAQSARYHAPRADARADQGAAGGHPDPDPSGALDRD